MAKTKKTIRKIVWDAERGIGIAREYVARDISFDTDNTKEDTVIREEHSIRTGSPMIHHTVHEPRASIPRSLTSQYVLDLRHLRHAAHIPITHSSLASRCIAYIRAWRVKRASAIAADTVPRSLSTHRFPAIHKAELTRLFTGTAISSLRFFSVDVSTRAVMSRTPILAEMSIGTILFSALFFLEKSAPLFRWIAARMSALLRIRVGMSWIRYALRRMRIEFFQDTTPSVQIVPVEVIPRIALRRTVLTFITIAIVLTLPLHAFSSYTARIEVPVLEQRGVRLADDAERAVAALRAGEWATARQTWARFQEQSEALGASVYLTHPLLGPLMSAFSGRARTARGVVHAATALGDAGKAIAELGAASGNKGLVTERLVRMQPAFDDLVHAVDSIERARREIDIAHLPPSVARMYGSIDTLIPEAQRFLGRGKGLFSLLPSLLGHDRPMRYLLLLQNDAEARPTGGFIGSVAVIDLDGGAVRKVFMPEGGSYDFQGSLRVNYRAPEPLQYVNSRFELQDANWWPDFPTSAKKILTLWEKSGGPTVDGVMAVNASLFEKLLPLVGPVAMPAYAKEITAENFFVETQKAVELEYDRKLNRPKQFLRDLALIVIERFHGLSAESFLPLIQTLLGALTEKDVQLYFTDPALEALALREHIGGAMTTLTPSDDALRIVRTNIGGEKTDRVVRDAVTHETTVGADGSLVDRVTITRVHGGKRGELFFGARSRDYLRVYVPFGSSLIDAEGFSLPTRHREVPPDTYSDDSDLAYLAERSGDAVRRVDSFTEYNRTVFGGWVELDPGEVKTLRLSYRLPFTLPTKPFPFYRLYLEQQSGRNTTTILHRMIASPTYALASDVPDTLTSPMPWNHDFTVLSTAH